MPGNASHQWTFVSNDGRLEEKAGRCPDQGIEHALEQNVMHDLEERKSMPSEKDRLSFVHDHLKNIATLSSAAVAIIFGFSVGVSGGSGFLAISLVGFVLSLLSALVAQAVLLAHYPIGDFDEQPKCSGNAIDKSIVITWSLFFLSVCLLAVSAFDVFSA